MSTAPRHFWDDASVGEYALGVMPHAERLRFAADLKNDAVLQKRLAIWEENFEPMARGIADVAPPSIVLRKIEERLFPAQKPLSLFQRLGFWQMATALGFGSLALMVTLPRLNPVEPMPMVAIIQGETLLLAASYDAADGNLSVSRKRGIEATGEDFELWVIAAGAEPVSIGVIKDGATTLINVPEALRAVIAGSTLAITNEPDGGSPDGKPTGKVLGSGTVVEI